MGRALTFSSIAAQKPTFHTFGSNLLESLNPLVKPENTPAKTTTASVSPAPSPMIMSIDNLAISEAAAPPELQPIATLEKPFVVGHLLAKVDECLRAAAATLNPAPLVSAHG